MLNINSAIRTFLVAETNEPSGICIVGTEEHRTSVNWPEHRMKTQEHTRTCWQTFKQYLLNYFFSGHGICSELKLTSSSSLLRIISSSSSASESSIDIKSFPSSHIFILGYRKFIWPACSEPEMTKYANTKQLAVARKILLHFCLQLFLILQFDIHYLTDYIETKFLTSYHISSYLTKCLDDSPIITTIFCRIECV